MDQHFNFLSIGAGLHDVFVRSSETRVIDDPESENGQALCLPLGAKLEVDTLKVEVGGGGANSAVAFARLGFKAAALCRVGKDLAGEQIKQSLLHEGVITNHLVTDPAHPTGQSFILLAPNGQRTAMAYRGAAAHFVLEDIDEELVRHSEWVYLSSIGGNQAVLTRIFALCHLHKVKVAWNPGSKELAHGQRFLTPLLQQTDILLLNREEAALLTDLPHHATHDILERLISFISKGMVVVTNGSDGASAFDGDHIETLPGNEVLVVDTTGAGDAFGSGLVAAHAGGASIDHALSFAIANAESVIGQIGAEPGLLREGALDHQVKKTTMKHHKA